MWLGRRMCLQGLGSRELGPTSTNPDTHLSGAVKVKAQVVRDAVGDGCRCLEAAPRSLSFVGWGWEWGTGYASKG